VPGRRATDNNRSPTRYPPPRVAESEHRCDGMTGKTCIPETLTLPPAGSAETASCDKAGNARGFHQGTRADDGTSPRCRIYDRNFSFCRSAPLLLQRGADHIWERLAAAIRPRSTRLSLPSRLQIAPTHHSKPLRCGRPGEQIAFEKGCDRQLGAGDDALASAGFGRDLLNSGSIRCPRGRDVGP